MSDMVERVAMLLSRQDSGDVDIWTRTLSEHGKGVFRDMAREIIAAMREPTPGMVEAGWAAAHDEDAADTWRDMIDAALAPEEKTDEGPRANLKTPWIAP